MTPQPIEATDGSRVAETAADPAPGATQGRQRPQAAVLARIGITRRTAPVAVVVSLAVIVLLLGAITTPAFMTADNTLNILRAASVIGIAALGMTFITMSGNFFSMSVGQTAALTAILFAMLMNVGVGWVVALFAVLAVAATIGALQGIVVAAGANPIITTLGTGAALFGVASVITDQQEVQIENNTALFFGAGRPLGIPTQTWAFVLLAIACTIVLLRTRLGRRVTLSGANRRAAEASGLNVKLATLHAFVISGAAAGLAGVFAAAQSSRGIVNQFPDFNTEVIAAVLVGGTLVQGGKGSIWQTFLGAVFIALVANLLALRGYSFGVRMTVEGLAVVAAVSMYALVRRRTT